jgi:hypothetical protein
MFLKLFGKPNEPNSMKEETLSSKHIFLPNPYLLPDLRICSGHIQSLEQYCKCPELEVCRR